MAHLQLPNSIPYFVQQSTPQIPYDRRWHLIKIVIRAWSAIFAFIVICIDISLAIKANRIGYSGYSSTFEVAFSTWIASLPPAALCLLWDGAEFLTLCMRRKACGRGIHPGAHVGMDLVLWLLLVIIWGILSSMIAWTINSSYGYYYYYNDDEEFDPHIRAIAVTVLVILILLSIIHFFLFVRACYETNLRNRMGKGGPFMLMSQQPMVQNGQQPRLFNGQPVFFQPQPFGQFSATPQPPMPMQPPQTYGGFYPMTREVNPLAGYYAPQPSQAPLAGYYAPVMSKKRSSKHRQEKMRSAPTSPIPEEPVVFGPSNGSEEPISKPELVQTGSSRGYPHEPAEGSASGTQPRSPSPPTPAEAVSSTSSTRA